MQGSRPRPRAIATGPGDRTRMEMSFAIVVYMFMVMAVLAALVGGLSGAYAGGVRRVLRHSGLALLVYALLLGAAYLVFRRVPLGFVLMWIAGVVSGLLGIGSGDASAFDCRSG